MRYASPQSRGHSDLVLLLVSHCLGRFLKSNAQSNAADAGRSSFLGWLRARDDLGVPKEKWTNEFGWADLWTPPRGYVVYLPPEPSHAAQKSPSSTRCPTRARLKPQG